ncbi:raftlin isoform X2 [Parambassis ranga]|nr:raftlin-like isoform X2 [Parambassis ranga]XP_028284468.1 raftlin-like isoform X2 [Parambassis ranga]XP_028284469.1 raftlin-like isoform X2 [Parambassis ranga]XP_028284470.1 raftlin-like isoform X2 [Parambassis ranga]
MGCRLPKLRKAEERRSPGNIYSTLRRPQVETKVGVAYTYHFLDFLLGKEEVPVSSVLCLSSVRELPVQVRELYTQGFVLVAVHPFVHPCGPRHAHIQRQLHRAVLVRETLSSEKSQLKWARNRLETDVCVAGHQVADPEVIQSYVKRIQDVAEQGVMFVGFLQQPGGGPCFLGQWDPEELSSLHSSPSPIHRHPFSATTSPTDHTESHQNVTELDVCPSEAQLFDNGDAEFNKQDTLVPREPGFSPLKPTHISEHNPEESNEQALKESTKEPQNYIKSQHPADVQDNQRSLSPSETDGAIRQEECDLPEPNENLSGSPENDYDLPNQKERRGSSSDSWLSSPELDHNHGRNSTCPEGQTRVTTHNNNHIRLKSSEKDKGATSPPAQARMQLFALYNHTEELNTSLRFYSLRVPLRVQRDSGLITEVDAHWLDHMTQHFSSGAHLIDGFFHLGDDNDNGVSSVDSVFIFQNSAEETTNTSYDAIVVEQWTVVDGVVVKADYVPLLQSLAPYGWRLMCVLPTPIVKTNNDGSLSTKQILFLQRPILQRKRKDFKMLNLRSRNKAKKNPTGDTLEERGENRSPVVETEMDKLGRRTKEEEEAEGRMSGDSGRSEYVQKGREQREEDSQHQKALLFLSQSRASVEEQEEETDIDKIPLSKQEKSVRWTDFCQGDDGGVKEEVKTEERIKQQLFSGVC